MNIDEEDFPMIFWGIKKFEKNNANFIRDGKIIHQISINVYMLEDKVFGEKEQKVVPVYLTDEERKYHVYLLLITDGENHHYTWIKKLSGLIGQQLFKHRGQKFICNR